MKTSKRIEALNEESSFEAGAKTLHEKMGIGAVDELIEHGYPGNGFFLDNTLSAIAELVAGLAEDSEDVRKFLLSREGVDCRRVDLAVSYLNKLLRKG